MGTHDRELSVGVRQYAHEKAILCEKYTEMADSMPTVSVTGILPL